MKTFILVRHCKAEGQEEQALLTEEGKKEAVELIDDLIQLDSNITKIISSPYNRAIKTIEPFANKVGLNIHIDNRLSERKLGSSSLDNWMEILKKTFEDPNFSLEGGESTIGATERAISLIHEEINCNKDQTTLLVTHGNLMTLILRHFDHRFGFDEWKSLTNPDIYKIDIQDHYVNIIRLWDSV